MCGRATLAIVWSSTVMIIAPMMEIITIGRLGAGWASMCGAAWTVISASDKPTAHRLREQIDQRHRNNNDDDHRRDLAELERLHRAEQELPDAPGPDEAQHRGRAGVRFEPVEGVAGPERRDLGHDPPDDLMQGRRAGGPHAFD